MRRLQVQIEIQGRFETVGEISGRSAADAAFSYAKSWISRPGAQPVSISLPLQEEAFSPSRTRIFFEGLLPEGYTRKCVAGWLHVDENDYLSVLAGLGKECLGALKILPEGEEEPGPSWRLLTQAELEAFAREGALKSAELVTKSHLSLTGASGKTGLYLDRETGNWYLPLGTAPSTHIVKQSHVRLTGIVVNESLCLRTAQKLGIRTPESFILNMPAADSETVLFATKRYDRAFPESGPTIDGLQVPLRLHQEDFAQALGIPAAEKYETAESGYLKKAFALLRNYSADPISDQLKLWDITIFNYLIGNTDNHIKNLSLLYGSDLRGIRLAPAYDIVSTMLYESSTENMAMFIGGEKNIHRITRESFAREAANVGLGVKAAMNRFDRMLQRFSPALLEAKQELEAEQAGLRLDAVCQKILNLHAV